MKEFKSFYKTIDNRKFNTWCKYTQRLDTYGCGCYHDCDYCYSKSLLDFRGLWNPLSPKVSNILEIEEVIKKLNKNIVIKIGGMTDCFQPIEKKHKVTYKTIKLLNKYRVNYLIVTKNSMVSDDEYIKIYDKSLSHFQITITNTNDFKCNKYENASITTKRIKSIEKLYKLGFDVSIRLSPYIENYIDFNVLNSIKCNKILIEFLKVSPFIKKCFGINYSEYNYKYGGYRHLDLNKKIKLIKNIEFCQISVGEYVKDHYEYFRHNVNYNKNDCCNLKPVQYELDFFQEPKQESLDL